MDAKEIRNSAFKFFGNKDLKKDDEDKLERGTSLFVCCSTAHQHYLGH